MSEDGKVVGIVCSRGRTHRCSAQFCSSRGAFQCDAPVAGGTCSAYVCGHHRTTTDGGLDLCPRHAREHVQGGGRVATRPAPTSPEAALAKALSGARLALDRMAQEVPEPEREAEWARIWRWLGQRIGRPLERVEDLSEPDARRVVALVAALGRDAEVA